MDLYKTIIYIKSQKIEEFSETFLIRPQGGGDTLFTGRRGHPVYREEETPCIQGGGEDGEYVYWGTLYTGRRGEWRICLLGHPIYREEGRMENMFIGTPCTCWRGGCKVCLLIHPISARRGGYRVCLLGHSEPGRRRG